MTLKPILLTLAIILITACGNSSTDSSEDAAARSEPDLPGEGYDRALERARGVEQDVMDAAQRQREQIDDQEGGN
jgi:hypothetical protein